jgi:hypothetical protein
MTASSADEEKLKFYRTEIKRMQHYLNVWIGFYYWRTYHNSRFWSNISTPVNLSLTLLTALMAGQATSSNELISASAYMNISFATMILTTLNSYFRPHVHATETNECLVKWISFGHKLDMLLYSDKSLKDLYEEYCKLLRDMNEYVCIQQTKHRNFFTDMWHNFVRNWYGPETENWMYETYKTTGEQTQESKVVSSLASRTTTNTEEQPEGEKVELEAVVVDDGKPKRKIADGFTSSYSAYTQTLKAVKK